MIFTDYVLLIGTIIGIHFIATVRPGPKFIISVKYGLSYPRGIALTLTTGITFGALIYVLLGFLGFTAIIKQSSWLYNSIKYIGIGYFIFLGARSIMICSNITDINELNNNNKSQESNYRAFFTGLITMMSNPMAALHFLLLFTVVCPADSSLFFRVFLIILLPIITWLWFSSVALMFSTKKFKQIYLRYQRRFGITFGVIMIGFGIRLFFYI